MTTPACNKQQHHVVAVPLPAQGHLNPLMRFCKLLAEQEGFIVTFVDFDFTHRRLQEVHNASADVPYTEQPNPSSPVAATSASPPTLIRRAQIPIPDLSKGSEPSFSKFFDSLLSIAPYLEQLILSLNHDGPPVTCMISDFNTTFPTQDVADKLGIPRIVLYPCCASRLLFTHYLLQGELSIDEVIEAVAPTAQRGKVFCKLPGLPAFLNSDVPHFKHGMDETFSMWTRTIKSWQVCNTRAHAVVVNSVGDLEGSTFATLEKCCDVPIYDAGFWVEPLAGKECATSLLKEDRACMSWLDQQPASSVLYISFGSTSLLSETQFEEVLNGVLSSQRRFLCVFRPDLVENSDGGSAIVASILSKCDGKGLVIDWAPQLQVLSHPSVGGFLTHCGWNSTCESIAHGVPMLCWPYFADQPLNARCIVDVWKVGLAFESDGSSFVERGEIERVIRALMEGPEGRLVRENVTRLKEKSNEWLLENGSSYLNLQALNKSLCT